MKVVVIGGGPAGMLSAYSSKKQGNEVILIEKMDSLGKKLLITGKGRCNITSSVETMDEFIANTPGNGRFLYSAFQNFTNKDIIKLLDIPTKVERGNRIFPVSNKAEDVLKALLKKLEGVTIYTNTTAEKIIVKNLVEEKKVSTNIEKKAIVEKKNNDITKAIAVKTDKGIIEADKIILATGGMSYPVTGSTGDGYKMAKELRHTVTELKPSLVAMTAKDPTLGVCKKLQGLTLKNIEINVYENEKKVYNDFGEMLFTHFGISGPIILSASAHLVRTKMNNVKVHIDLKPALNEEKLNERILRDFDKYKNKEIKNALDDLLPQKLIPVIVELSNINPNKKVNEITKEERLKLLHNLKCLTIEIKGYRPIEEAIITSGGISIKEINPKTMESKLVKNLYFAGEIIDVDAYTGGFNLQIAYSTGFTSGLNKE